VLNDVAGERVLHVVGAGVDLRLEDVTIAGGRPETDPRGGAILSDGDGELVLERVVVRENRALSLVGGVGGGIHKGGGILWCVTRSSPATSPAPR
jgi:hypothetical protein